MIFESLYGCYTPAKRSLKGVLYRNQRVVGRSVGPLQILRRELHFLSVLINSHEIWHRCLPWGVDVQDTFLDSGKKCVAMVTAYYGKKLVEILRRELLPQFFTNSHEIWHRCLPWGVDVQDTFLDSGRKCVAMVTAYYGGKIGGNLASRTTSSVFDQFS